MGGLTPDHIRRALADEEAAQRWTNRLIRELHDAGCSWRELAEASGLTVAALRWRAQQSVPDRAAVQEQIQQPTSALMAAISPYSRAGKQGLHLIRMLDAEGARKILAVMDDAGKKRRRKGWPSTGALLRLVADDERMQANGVFIRGGVLFDELLYRHNRETTRELTARFTVEGLTPTVSRTGNPRRICW